jgi:hypothetical protein
MITQRGVEEPEKRSVFQAVTRYHSEEDADRHWLAKVRRNMHSNQSNYLMKRRTEKQEPNEETIHLQSETQKIKDVCLPLSTSPLIKFPTSTPMTATTPSSRRATLRPT